MQGFLPAIDVNPQLNWNIITTQKYFQFCDKALENANCLGQNELQVQLQENEKKKKNRKALQIKLFRRPGETTQEARS